MATYTVHEGSGTQEVCTLPVIDPGPPPRFVDFTTACSTHILCAVTDTGPTQREFAISFVTSDGTAGELSPLQLWS